MPQRDLAERLSVSEQAIKQMEQREVAGTISLNVLQKAADAMGLDLVYGFIPRTTSLESMVEEQILHYLRRHGYPFFRDDYTRKRMEQLLEKPKSEIWEIKIT